LADLLSSGGPIEVGQFLLPQASRVGCWPSIDVNRLADGPQLQLVADPDSTLLDKCFGQCDLKFTGDLRHRNILARVKDLVKDMTATESRVAATIASAGVIPSPLWPRDRGG
jgi:hypothetical protein